MPLMIATFDEILNKRVRGLMLEQSAFSSLNNVGCYCYHARNSRIA